MADTMMVDDMILKDVTDDFLKVFSKNGEYLTKAECKNFLSDIFKLLFEDKLKSKNFEHMFESLAGKGQIIIRKDKLEPVIKSLIISFNVNYITNTTSFNDKVCIKIGKNLLPVDYQIKEIIKL